ncbi:MAG: DegT/DnrJ/EryC1/StrS family aminotransferase, partial [Chloroflexota bacterium]
LYERATPRFVDIEPDSLGLDPEAIAAAAGPRTVGVLPVHVFGRPCRIHEISAIAERQGWHLVEDACEALGAASNGRRMGTFGAASVFAFYPNKQITTGEGGMVVTDDAALAEDLRSLRNQGRDSDGTWLNHVQLGYNYRLDDLSAAIGIAQLERIEELRAGRARVAAAYARALSGIPELRVPAAGPDEQVDWFVYVIRLHEDVDRERLMAFLADRGVASRPYFNPLHLQPLYRERLGHGPGDFPVTERIAATTLALPWSSLLSEEDVAYVAEALIAGLREQSGA